MRRSLSEEELAALYHGIGACIWQMQYLEDALHTFLTLKIEIRTRGAVNEETARQLLLKYRRATLGTALHTAERNQALPGDLIAALRTLKDERDWLIHRSWNEDGHSLYTDEGRASVWTRILAIQEEIHRLKAALVKELELERFCTDAGIDQSEVDLNAQQAVAKLRGER
jgi:hypothetical protein